MVIAVDLDGVVFDSEEYFRVYAHLYDLHTVNHGLRTKSAADPTTRHEWDKNSIDEFYEKFTEEILTKAPIKPGAKYVLEELRKRGHKLICITLRGYYRECEKRVTEDRFNKEGVVFDKIFYSEKDKLSVCLAEKVDVIIEDNINTISKISQNGIRCFHFGSFLLNEFVNENVTQVQNWADIYESILKLEKQI